MFEQHLSSPVGRQHGILALDQLVDQRHRPGDVRVLVLAQEILDGTELNDLFDLVQSVAEGQLGARIDQYRLVSLLNQIAVALKRVVRQIVADPPDPVGDLDRF
jgi:hypothetical protein